MPQAFVLPAIGATRRALISAHSAHRPFFLLAPLFVRCLLPAFHEEILRLDRLETTIANSADPLHPRFCLSSCAFHFPKVDRCRQLIVSKEILPFSDLRCIAFPGFHLFPIGSGSGVRAGLLIKTRKDMSSVPAAPGMTDVSLPIFQVEVQERWIQMIDAKAASNCWRRRPSASNFGLRHIGTNSFGWDHHGTKTPNFVAVFSWFSGVRTIESS